MSKDYFEDLAAKTMPEMSDPARYNRLLAGMTNLLRLVAAKQRHIITAEIEKLRDPYFHAGKSREQIIDRVLEIVRNTMPEETMNEQ